MMDLQEACTQLPWLQDTPSIWAIFTTVGRRVSFDAGDVIYTQSDPSADFYYILSGRVRTYTRAQNGAERLFMHYDGGSLLGFASFWDGQARLDTARAEKACQMTCIDADTFARLLDAHPGLMRALMCDLTRAVRLMSYSNTYLSADRRIAQQLHHLYRGVAGCARDGMPVSLSCTHEDIANLSGTCRVTATRALHQFQQNGWLRLLYGKIHILNAPALLQYAQLSI
nr:Crp/Fnr family transcriptional regulator [Maliibacterium massiliense]